MNNQTDIGLKFSNDITNTDKLEKYATNLEKIKTVLQAFDSNKLKEVESAVAIAGSSDNQKNIKKTSSALNAAFGVGKLGVFTITIDKLVKKFSQMAESSATYLENMNLLDVAYNNNTTSADKLVNRMTEMYGLDESWGYKTVGMFKQLANAMDITGETGTKMSNVLSLLAVDLSSLYNVGTAESVEKLESALAGQTKPIRSYGADITEMTLQQTLLNNSIDLTVGKLSFAEKRLLIVSAILQQTKESNNDWARTIESLANQMRIFDEQISRLTRSIGNIFLPVLKTILPYLNAILMVLVEITSWIATLVGYDPKEFDFFTDADTGVNNFSSSVDGLGSSLDSASDSAKKLKQGLRGFDKLNSITTPTTTSGGTSGSSGGTGISSEILDLFNKTTDDYLSKLTDVKMRATEIRDKIMEWLGFTKEIDDATGDVSFKLKEGFTRYKLITTLLKTIIGYKIIKKLGTLISKSTVLKGITTKIFSKLGGGTTKLTKLSKGFNTTALSVAGLAVSLVSAYSAGKDCAQESVPLSNKILELGGSMLGASASAAALGFELGGIKGAIIGGLIGAIVSLGTAWVGWIKQTNENTVREEVLDGLGVKLETITKYYSDMFNAASEVVEPLENLRQKYYETQENISSLEEEIINFETALDEQDKTISQSQLDELATKYDNLILANKEATNATIDYEKGIINSMKKAGTISQEEAAKQISAIEKLKLAQQGYQDEYIKKMGDLKEQYFSNKISTEEYNEKILELNDTYGKTNNELDSITGKVSNFAHEINDIDYTSPEKATEAIKNIDTAFQNTNKSIEENREATDKYYNEEIAKQEEILGKFLDGNGQMRTDLNSTQKEIAANATKQIDKLKELQSNASITYDNLATKLAGDYKGFLATIYADLASQGADTSKEWDGVFKTIKGSLEELEDVEVTGVGKTMLSNVTDEIQKNSPQTMKKINTYFNKYGINAGESWQKAIVNQFTSDLPFIKNSSSETGKTAVQGFTSAIKQNQANIETSGKNIGTWTINGTKKALDSHSPSKVYSTIGNDTIQGFINGIKDKKTTLLEEVSELLREMQKKFTDLKLQINISTNVEKSYNSILTKTQTFINRFRSAINQMLASMTTSMNGIKVKDNKITYTSMPYISIPRFKQGIDYVPKDFYLSYLDEGERVLTKQENQDYTRNKMFGNQRQVPQTIIVQVGSKEVAKVVLDDLQDRAKDLGKPITITG